MVFATYFVGQGRAKAHGCQLVALLHKLCCFCHMSTGPEGTLEPKGHEFGYLGQDLAHTFVCAAIIAQITEYNFRKYLKKYEAVLLLLCP